MVTVIHTHTKKINNIYITLQFNTLSASQHTPAPSPVSRAEFKYLHAIRLFLEVPVGVLFPLPVRSWQGHVGQTAPTPCTEAGGSLRVWRKIVTIFRVTKFPFVYHHHHHHHYHHHTSHQPFSFPVPPSQLANTLTQICVTTDERGNYTDSMPLHYAIFFLLKEGSWNERVTTLATSIFSLALGTSFSSLNNESVETE